ncbi:MAG: M15 family metallopeptidase [Clostridia bacterium]|nr:M15 family metallopeptidase [Clostridia bacterium]
MVNSNKFSVLVNKNNPLPKDYVPCDLVRYEGETSTKIDENHKVFVEKETLERFFDMQEDARKLDYEILIDSGYRSYDYQKPVLDFYANEVGSMEEALKTVAKPGESEHQTGLAIDFIIKRNGLVIEKMEDSFDEVKWIHENCFKYGFILRYPKGFEQITGYDYEL